MLAKKCKLIIANYKKFDTGYYLCLIWKKSGGNESMKHWCLSQTCCRCKHMSRLCAKFKDIFEIKEKDAVEDRRIWKLMKGSSFTQTAFELSENLESNL